MKINLTDILAVCAKEDLSCSIYVIALARWAERARKELVEFCYDCTCHNEERCQQCETKALLSKLEE